MVTPADGTTTLETLGQAGVRSINLTPDSSGTVLPDGWHIHGVTRSDRIDDYSSPNACRMTGITGWSPPSHVAAIRAIKSAGVVGH